jgi:hypothetical protein
MRPTVLLHVDEQIARASSRQSLLHLVKLNRELQAQISQQIQVDQLEGRVVYLM